MDEEIKLPENLRNKIFSWHGGGYDGCIWEPNLAYTDEEGNYHPVISTGNDGIPDIETLLDVVDEAREHEKTEADGKYHYFSRKPFCILDMTQDSIDTLCRTVRTDYVAYLVDELNEDYGIGAKSTFDMVCTHCGRHFASMDYSFRDIVSIVAEAGYYRGDGGIGIITNDIFCDDCRYDLIETIHEGDWINVSGSARVNLGLKSYSYEVKRVTEDGDYIIEEDDKEIEIPADDAEKSY